MSEDHPARQQTTLPDVLWWIVFLVPAIALTIHGDGMGHLFLGMWIGRFL